MEQKVKPLGFFFILISLWLFSSCEKDELPVQKHSSGDVTTTQIELGSTYETQVYYSLSSNTIVSTNHKLAWDLGFEASKDGWHVKLNTGRGGAIAQTTETDFSKITSEKDLKWKHDVSSGNLDSTAMGDYRNTNWVYVMDRGYDADGNHTGYFKFKVQVNSDNSYTIRFAELSSNSILERQVLKNEAVNFVCFSFEQKQVVNIEPPKESWDLFFGHYTHLFHEPYTPYLVTGVLLNPYKVVASKQNEISFSDITLKNSKDLELTPTADIIGYNWKVFDFKAASYTVFADSNWVIKDRLNRRFKFHFIDFYNEKGEKGSPKFEFQEL